MAYSIIWPRRYQIRLARLIGGSSGFALTGSPDLAQMRDNVIFAVGGDRPRDASALPRASRGRIRRPEPSVPDRSVPDRLVRLHVEELHAFGLDLERDPLAHLGLGVRGDPGHALARLRGRVLVVGARALGRYPGGVDGEVNHELRTERLDQVHVADQGRPGAAVVRGGQMLGPNPQDHLLAAVAKQPGAGRENIVRQR